MNNIKAPEKFLLNRESFVESFKTAYIMELGQWSQSTIDWFLKVYCKWALRNWKELAGLVVEPAIIPYEDHETQTFLSITYWGAFKARQETVQLHGRTVSFPGRMNQEKEKTMLRLDTNSWEFKHLLDYNYYAYLLAPTHCPDVVELLDFFRIVPNAIPKDVTRLSVEQARKKQLVWHGQQAIKKELASHNIEDGPTLLLGTVSGWEVRMLISKAAYDYEAVMQRHCVDSYWHPTGRASMILRIRRNDEWYTVELRNKLTCAFSFKLGVVQMRGKYNAVPPVVTSGYIEQHVLSSLMPKLKYLNQLLEQCWNLSEVCIIQAHTQHVLDTNYPMLPEEISFEDYFKSKVFADFLR